MSVFEPGGVTPKSTSRYERRAIATHIPVWDADKCTQCNYCSLTCPHAAIRPFLLTKEEISNAPSNPLQGFNFETRKAKGGGNIQGYNYTLQVAPMDCTGCQVCVHTCPDNALHMESFDNVAYKQLINWDYCTTKLPDRSEMHDKFTVKGSQFQKPLMEFCGACGKFLVLCCFFWSFCFLFFCFFLV